MRFFKPSALESMVAREVIISGYCSCIFCSACPGSDTDVIGLGVWPLWCTSVLCSVAGSGSVMMNSCISILILSSTGVKQSIRGASEASAGVTAGMVSELMTRYTADKPEDILFLNLL